MHPDPLTTGVQQATEFGSTYNGLIWRRVIYKTQTCLYLRRYKYILFFRLLMSLREYVQYVEGIDRLIVCPERAAVPLSVQHTLAPFSQRYYLLDEHAKRVFQVTPKVRGDSTTSISLVDTSSLPSARLTLSLSGPEQQHNVIRHHLQ